MRIDCHLHLWDPGRFPYSWCAGIPALNRSFLPADYLGAAEGCGVLRAVFVECDVDEPHAPGEARWIQELAGTSGWIAGLVASARPERADFPERLEDLLALPLLRGIRRVLHVVPDETSQSPLFAEHVRRLGPLGLTFDLCVLERQLPLVLSLVRACPDTRFVLDHCGGPDLQGGSRVAWHARLAEIAANPNVVCKISGLVAGAAPDWSAETLRPWLEGVVEVFGWDRVVWGGDWPVCTLRSPLRAWVEACDRVFAGASEEERAKLFHRNAVRVYALEP